MEIFKKKSDKPFDLTQDLDQSENSQDHEKIQHALTRLHCYKRNNKYIYSQRSLRGTQLEIVQVVSCN